MSDITINGAVFPDGAPLPINGVQAEEVTVNGISVWKNTSVPSNIVDFVASDDQHDQVTMTFTPADGLPAPTHDLYRDGGLVASGIVSGHVYAVIGSNTSTYKVRAVNVAGTTDSNDDVGIARRPAGEVIFNVPGAINWLIPEGLLEGSVCAAGGGGGGADGSLGFPGAGGGGSGAVSLALVFTPGGSVTGTVGAGGVRGFDRGTVGGNTEVIVPGNATTTSIGLGFGTWDFGGVGIGGVGGSGGGKGGDPGQNGGDFNGCGGNYLGGQLQNNIHGGPGGAGGFGNGGNNPTSVLSGPTAGGYGGHGNEDWLASNGGNGYVKISWPEH